MTKKYLTIEQAEQNQKQRLKQNVAIAFFAVVAVVLALVFIGCASIKGYIDPYARNPEQAWELLCGEEGQVTQMCRDEGQGCEEARLVCDVLAVTLGVMEMVDDG